MAQVIDEQFVAGSPHVRWDCVQDDLGRVFLRFGCGVCRDKTLKRCSDPMRRGTHWASTYAHLHPSRPHKQ